METEDLFIGLDRIAVDYTFRNKSDADVTGEVIFPLPPISIGALWNIDYNLPDDIDRENLVNFTVTVDGQAVTPKVDRVAVLNSEWWNDVPGNVRYDTPGKDVTADLERLGIPLSMDIDKVDAALKALTPEQQAEAAKLGLAEFMPADGEIAAENMPQWAIVIRYHWTQTFPAGKALSVSHEYENHPPGGLFTWDHPPTADYEKEIAAKYCIDDGTSKMMARNLEYQDQDGTTYRMGTSYETEYVLRTANSWAGPIGKFKLTLDKAYPDYVISLCADGVKKTGPTTFVVEKTDYTPDRDLNILVVKPFNPAE